MFLKLEISFFHCFSDDILKLRQGKMQKDPSLAFAVKSRAKSRFFSARLYTERTNTDYLLKLRPRNFSYCRRDKNLGQFQREINAAPLLGAIMAPETELRPVPLNRRLK